MNSNSSDLPIRRSAPPPRRITAVVPVVVLFALLGVIFWNTWPLLRPAREVQVVQAVFDRSSTEQAESGLESPTRNVPTVQAPGWLEAGPFYVACTALADGIVESIEVLEGDFVEEGEVVAKLISEDAELRLRRAEADLAIAHAGLSIALAEHAAAGHSWDEPVHLERAVATWGASVAEGEAELAQLPSLIESAVATLTRLDDETMRVRNSTEQGGANEFELIRAEQRSSSQFADVAALKARRAILDSRVARFRAEFRSAERDLDLRIEDRRRLDAAEAGIASSEAFVMRSRVIRDEAALELDRMIIRAPISGYVQHRLKAPGDKVIRMMDSPRSAQLVHLYDPKQLQVRVDVPLADVSHVQVGQPCEVVVEVLPDRVFDGEVLRITHSADLQKNTLQVKVKVIDPDPMLRPEMLTRVKFLPPENSDDSASFLGSTTGTRVFVPVEAVNEVAGVAQVWIVANRSNGRGLLLPQIVNVVERTQDWLVITGDVQTGTLLAVGVQEPREGERVIVRSTNKRINE